MTRTAKLYLLITSVAVLGIFGLLHLGVELPPPPAATGATAQVVQAVAAHAPVAANAGFLASATQSLFQNSASGLGRLFLQLFIIILAASIVGGLFTRLGQPAVVGEMMAGILLGPSLFGWLAPNAFGFFFAPST